MRLIVAAVVLLLPSLELAQSPPQSKPPGPGVLGFVN